MTKPRNWRTYYGYRPPSFSSSPSPFTLAGIGRAEAYIRWLANERGWTREQAAKYCAKMDERKLISAQFSAEEAPSPKLPPAMRKRRQAIIERARKALELGNAAEALAILRAA